MDLNKKVFIAGGGGFIGTRLANQLNQSGWDVTVLDYFWFGDYLDDGIRKQTGGIFDLTLDSFEEENYHAVVFLAGLSNDPMANYDPVGNFVENGASPSYLAFLTKKAGIPRFVYASSCSEYGFTDGDSMDETSSPSPQYPYGIAKLQAESAIMMLEDETFRPISLRKGTVGGWSPRMRYDLVVNAMTKSALTKGQITVNNPSLWRPLVDIRDVVQSYVLSIEADLSISGIFNISNKNYTVGEIAEQVQKQLAVLGHASTIETKHIQDVRNYKASNQKARDLLGFDPQYDIGDSVKELLQNTDLNNHDFSDKIYYNIETYKEHK